MTMPRPDETLRDTVTRLLDDGYTGAASSVVRAIGNNMNSGLLEMRLKQLEEEAARLVEAGQQMRPDNAYLTAFFDTLEDTLKDNRALINAATGELGQNGVVAAETISLRLVTEGLPQQVVAAVNGQWNRPDPNAVAGLVDFTSDPAWNDLLKGYTDRMIERVNDRALFGFVNGWNPLRTARELRKLTQGADGSPGLAKFEAETIMRTLQLSSYRRGVAAYQAANAQILEPEAVRIAVLDMRTCLACVALHGKRIPLGEPVRDHWNGRCTSVAMVRGYERQIQTGEEWFNALPEGRQQQQRAFNNNPSYWAAYRAGDVRLDDFVEEATDPVFGEMVMQASLSGILGDGARRYYGQGRG
jgi:hypothetical protein